jgi:hypothetical protein
MFGRVFSAWLDASGNADAHKRIAALVRVRTTASRARVAQVLLRGTLWYADESRAHEAHWGCFTDTTPFLSAIRMLRSLVDQATIEET